MNIYFKFDKNGEMTLKGYIFSVHFEFQAYNRCAWINFPETNQSFILRQSDLDHFVSFMTEREAKKLIWKGFFYYLISKLQSA